MRARAAISALFLILLCPALSIAAPGQGELAPDFTGTTTNGASFSLSQLRGRVVIVDFFALWCSPCRQLPLYLNRITKQYNIAVIGLDVDATEPAKINSYVKEKGISYPIMAAGGKIQRDYGVKSLPLLYIVGKDGRIVEKFQGFNATIADAIENIISKTL